jgi:ribosomal protein S18 acetylase RimI-like enzyme
MLRRYRSPYTGKLLDDHYEFMVKQDHAYHKYGEVTVRDFQRGGFYKLYNLFINQKSRGLGFGTKMMSEIIKKFHDKPIQLDVLKGNNAALALYNKMGFTIVKEYKDFYNMERKVLL